jgi:hypothetical protein
VQLHELGLVRVQDGVDGLHHARATQQLYGLLLKSPYITPDRVLVALTHAEAGAVPDDALEHAVETDFAVCFCVGDDGNDRMNVFGVPALFQEVFWWCMHHLTPWDISTIDVEKAIQQVAGFPILVRALTLLLAPTNLSARPDQRACVHLDHTRRH